MKKLQIKEQLNTKLPKQYTSISGIYKNEYCTEVSVYSGKLTQQGIIDSIKKIKLAFPDLPYGFYDIFSDRLKSKGFNDNRLTDAVNNVIDTCEYPKPTIAKFLGFDNRIKFYNYEQYQKLVFENTKIAEQYKAVIVKFSDVVMWAHVSDIKRYNLTLKNK